MITVSELWKIKLDNENVKCWVNYNGNSHFDLVTTVITRNGTKNEYFCLEKQNDDNLNIYLN